MKPTSGDVDMNMKPDIALLKKDPFDPSGLNSWCNIVAFLELSSSSDFSHMSKQLTRKAYTIFVVQPSRCFIITLSISNLHFHLHIFDHASVHDANHLFYVLYMLAFAPEEFISYDTTLLFSPIIA